MPDKPISLPQALKNYNKQADHEAVLLAEQKRLELVQKFPLAEWPTMPLERYALGLGDNENSYCWWMEFGTMHVASIKGGSARKLTIYKQSDGSWYYDRQTFKNEQDAWKSLRDSFVATFKAAEAGDWINIDQLSDGAIRPALRAKSLYCYFPNDLLPLTSTYHIRTFLDRLEVPWQHADGVVHLNRVLFDSLRQRPEFTDWKPKELERFLYNWADPRDQRRIVKIAPGGDAKFWPECLKEGYIKVGWGKAGDLRQFESREAYRVKFEDAYGATYNKHQPMITKKSKEVWTLRELEPGDFVVANHGTSKILAVGEVVEPGYEWIAQPDDFNNIVRVKWDTSYAQDIPPQKSWAMATVADVPQVLAAQILSKMPAAVGDNRKGKQTPPLVPVDQLFQQISSALERKGQAVLYGPPGTGKTYAARRFAVWWLMRQLNQPSPELVLSDAAAFSEAEKELSTAQVGGGGICALTCLTFHPSYSYEDFIEGFRPVDTKGGNLALRLEDGIFKRVCREAQANPAKPFLVLIDEINRANVAKVFGELITLLEKDKRGMLVSMPQSKESFAIPKNVFLLGTMNTADRSIKLLDAALRRRFSFLELMPDSSLLAGGKVGNLALDEFLDELNRRIAAKEGREKQIGHSFLLDGDGPATDPEEFARRFRQEILPLLQEYCYEDYRLLADYIGEKLVNRDAQTLNEEVLADAEELVAALEEEFTKVTLE